MKRQAAAFSDGGKLIVPRSLKNSGTSLIVFLKLINMANQIALSKHISATAVNVSSKGLALFLSVVFVVLLISQ